MVPGKPTLLHPAEHEQAGELKPGPGTGVKMSGKQKDHAFLLFKFICSFAQETFAVH